jgi:predicted membrane chloride channel (bestrophin family)
MTVEYDPTYGTFFTALQLKDTVVSQVLVRFDFYFLLCFHFATRVAVESRLFDPSDFGLELPMGLTEVTGSLMTFFVVFYNGSVFSRYNRFYDLTKGLGESTLRVIMILSREMKDTKMKRKLTKMVLASCFIFFFERTPSDEDDSNMSQAEWDQLVSMGLLDVKQEMRLKMHCERLGMNAMPSLMLLSWSMKLYRLGCNYHLQLERTYWDVRRNQEDVVEMLEMPMPWQYFHIMNMMLMMNLMLWAYSFALQLSHFATLIFVFVTAIFMGIRELSVALADPYGDDAADFPLNDWMNTLYVRAVELCEDDWTAQEMFEGTSDEPLPQPKLGLSVIDLFQDAALNSKGKRKLCGSSTPRSHQAALHRRSTKTGDFDQPHHTQSRKSVTTLYESARAATGSMVQHTRDGGGSYTQIPALSADEEQDDESADEERFAALD